MNRMFLNIKPLLSTADEIKKAASFPADNVPGRAAAPLKTPPSFANTGVHASMCGRRLLTPQTASHNIRYAFLLPLVLFPRRLKPFTPWHRQRPAPIPFQMSASRFPHSCPCFPSQQNPFPSAINQQRNGSFNEQNSFFFFGIFLSELAQCHHGEGS
uniref:T. brucei spp.-specific protein n=1 Tax=Trypanosoma brucei brucei (strain 927/4 GUTat10.1) TaxID=185431 RepID=Q4FKV1_TRYB2|nr:hypothetical protein, unlikely [Trypanosoma brucei brucei TREU927]